MRTLTILGVVAAVLAMTGLAHANVVTYTYEFTAADMFNRQYVNGVDASTAADNGLFDGARLLRVGTNGNHADAGRTYVASQHENFDNRWDTYAADGYVYDAFNLWGLDGRGAHWGEDFKPLQWINHTGPDGWTTHYYDWAWSDPPSDAHTTLFPGWYVQDPQNAISMNATEDELAALLFSVTIEFDTDDAFWGQNTKGAPNQLGIGEDLTFWFGGWLTDYDGSSIVGEHLHLYEGNMVLTAVPVPGAALLGFFGLGWAGMKLRKRV